MANSIRKHKSRDGYEVGSRPPSDLSEKAKRQLQRSHVSPKLMSLVEKARNAKITRVDLVKGNAEKDFASDESTTADNKRR